MTLIKFLDMCNNTETKITIYDMNDPISDNIPLFSYFNISEFCGRYRNAPIVWWNVDHFRIKENELVIWIKEDKENVRF